MINADPRTRDSIWMAVTEALSSLADPRVLDAVNPPPGEEFDPADFLQHNGTLYLLATGAGAGASWALVAAFIEDLAETARHLAAASPGARLDPPLLLALDEIGNLAPLPSLPTLMAEGGGTGITTMPVLQSMAQARDKWGEHAPPQSGTPPSSRSSWERLSLQRPPRAHNSHRRKGRTHRHHHHRRPRLPLLAALDEASTGPPARTPTHLALRNRPRSSAPGAPDRCGPPPLDRPSTSFAFQQLTFALRATRAVTAPDWGAQFAQIDARRCGVGQRIRRL